MLTIVAMKWKRNSTGHIIPHVIDYGPDHVNRLYSSLKRNLSIPFRFVLISDDFSGLFNGIEKIQIWNTFSELGGCYRRLFLFSDNIRKYLGDRFVSIDLDCVITGNLDTIFSRKEDFIINEYPIEENNNATHQYYNGGLFMMTAGCRKQVWDIFSKNPMGIINEIKERNRNKVRPELVGSDQAVIAHLLKNNEALFTKKDGVYDYRRLSNKFRGKALPAGAKIVFFPGKRDPLTEYYENSWIEENWK